MRAAAVQIVRTALQQSGTILAIRPQDAAAAEPASQVQAVISSVHSREAIVHRCRIPAVVAAIAVEPAQIAFSPQVEQDSPSVSSSNRKRKPRPRRTPKLPAATRHGTGKRNF